MNYNDWCNEPGYEIKGYVWNNWQQDWIDESNWDEIQYTARYLNSRFHHDATLEEIIMIAGEMVGFFKQYHKDKFPEYPKWERTNARYEQERLRDEQD